MQLLNSEQLIHQRSLYALSIKSPGSLISSVFFLKEFSHNPSNRRALRNSKMLHFTKHHSIAAQSKNNLLVGTLQEGIASFTR